MKFIHRIKSHQSRELDAGCFLVVPVKRQEGVSRLTYSSVLNNRPLTFFMKSDWISLLRPDSLLTFCPYYYSGP